MAVLSAKAKVSAAANAFRKLAANLRKVADGEAVDVVLDAVVAQFDGVARSRVERWRVTGYAADHTKTTRDTKGVELVWPKYLDYHAGWPFAKGLPRFIVDGASALLRDVTARMIATGSSAGVALEARTSEAAAKKAEKKAAAKAAAKQRAAERKYDRLIKAREDRE